jgi:hypothetical protein
MSETPIQRLQQVADPTLITVKNGLVKVQKQNDVLLVLREKLATYPATYALKSCNEFLLYVCKLIEAVILKKDKIIKIDFLVTLYRQLFIGLTEPEVTLIKSGVEFLHSNQMIKNIKTSKRVKSFFLKKISCLL